MARTLIAYFSRADENYFGGAIRTIEVGNTEVAAKQIAEMTGGDLFHIEPAVPYPVNYQACTEQAMEEQKKDARPELKAVPESISEYDEIYLGYPIYWNTMPMPVFTFLDRFDWNGKTIHPFCTHEGSGLGRSVQDVKRQARGADVTEGLEITGSRVRGAQDKIRAFVERWK